MMNISGNQQGTAIISGVKKNKVECLSSLGAMLIEHMPLQSQVPLLPANPEAEHMEIEMDESVANAAAKQRQLERAETIR